MNDIQSDGFLGMKLVPGVAGFVGGSFDTGDSFRRRWIGHYQP